MRPAPDYLFAGFGTASRRVHYVLLDMITKGVFLVIAFIVMWFSVLWFIARIPLTDSERVALESGIPPLAAIGFVQAVLASLPLLVQSLVVAALIWIVLWTGIEAFVRGGLFPLTNNTLLKDAVLHFPRYLLTGAIRRSTLVVVGILVGLVSLGPLLTMPVAEWSSRWPEVQWSVVAGVVLVALLAFFLTILDTLIRCDALDLLGRSLPAILLVVGFPTLMEVSMWSLAAAVCVMSIAAPMPGGVTLALMAALVVGLSAMHSYLLLARYSAVGIMHRDS
jgi:hypothetical protein